MGVSLPKWAVIKAFDIQHCKLQQWLCDLFSCIVHCTEMSVAQHMQPCILWNPELQTGCSYLGNFTILLTMQCITPSGEVRMIIVNRKVLTTSQQHNSFIIGQSSAYTTVNRHRNKTSSSKSWLLQNLSGMWMHFRCARKTQTQAFNSPRV